MTTLAENSVRIIASDNEAVVVAREVAKHLASGASDRDRARTIPHDELDVLSRNGLLALTVPKELGGADVSTETLVKVFELLSAADPAVTQLTQSHFVFLEALRRDGSPEQQRFFFAEVLAGARHGNAQAERGSSSALDLKTRLRRTGPAGFRLDGTKHYCTGAIVAHRIPVAAIDDEGRLVTAFVGRDDPGVEVLADWNAMGQRATYSGTTHLRDVKVPASHVVPHWKLFERPSNFHAFGQLLHATIDLGIARNALEEGVAIVGARKRPRLGAPGGDPTRDPLILYRFGKLSAKFHAAEALILRAARLLDEAGGEPGAEDAADVAVATAEAKAFVEDVSIEITGEIFALIGTSSTDEDLNLNRHWRNARTHTVHDANDWKYHAVGNRLLNGEAPGKPVRKLVSES